MRTRRTNLATAAWGPRARRSGVPRRVGGDSTPRAPERRPANPALGGEGRTHAEARLPLDAHSGAIYALVVPGDRLVVRGGTRAGSAGGCLALRTPTAAPPAIRPSARATTPR